MEMQTTLSGGFENFPDVEIVKKIRRVRYNRIQIPSSSKLVIVAGDDRTAERLLREKREWIEKKLAHLKEMESLAEVKDGIFYYFGMPRSLEEIGLSRKKSRAELLASATAYLVQNAPAPPKVCVRRMRSRLGTYCAKKDEIRLSAYLVFLPQELVDYVIFHELTHREIRGHGGGFWRRIAERYPDWKQKEKELDLWWLRVKKQIGKYKVLEYI